MKARFGRTRRGRNDRGAVAVEFAIISIFALIPLIGGLVEAGFAFQAQISMNQAARAAVRSAAICGSSCTSAQAIKDAAGLGSAQGVVVNVRYCAGSPPSACIGSPGTSSGFTFCPTGAGQSDGSMEVTIFYPDRFTFALLPTSVAPTFNLVGEASMPCGG